jgi:hypothetical protein
MGAARSRRHRAAGHNRTRRGTPPGALVRLIVIDENSRRIGSVTLP